MRIQVIKLIAEPQLETVRPATALEGRGYTGAVGEVLSILYQQQAALLVEVEAGVEVDSYGVGILEGVCQVAVRVAEEGSSALSCVDVVPDFILPHYLKYMCRI